MIFKEDWRAGCWLRGNFQNAIGQIHAEPAFLG